MARGKKKLFVFREPRGLRGGWPDDQMAEWQWHEMSSLYKDNTKWGRGGAPKTTDLTSKYCGKIILAQMN